MAVMVRAILAIVCCLATAHCAAPFGEEPPAEPAPTCGDGYMNTPEEQCDDGNHDETDVCQYCRLVGM